LARAGHCALLFRRAAAVEPWVLHSASPEAPALLGRTALARPGRSASALGSLNVAPLAWADVCARLPADVARAVGEQAPAETRQAGEWLVTWDFVAEPDDPQAGRLLILRRAPPSLDDASSAQPTAAEHADQESFVYSVSHDLRAPIRVVEGFARILKEDYGRFLDRIGNDHADRILAAAARMNSMIDALLALSRLQSQPLKRQPVDLSQLARYVIDDLRSQAPERQVEVEIQPDLVIRGDPTLLRVAMENLVGNAWKYTGQAAAPRIALRREVVAGQDAFVVDDNGAGFDPRFADRLFGVFQRLHSAKDFPGTGVGLASVRRIVRRHGGDIWAESRVGAGARFYFTLPD
ncbi:MAG TPA: ATP-binding protein, partial [Burkholderiaceae bacterium]|nr:ATP-binding protein [Burkholderiaceae bacterium]